MRKIVGISLILSLACSKSDVDVPDPGLDYYPVSIGKYVDYRVNLIEFVDGVWDTSAYFMRESIDSSDVDLEGRQVFYLNRSTRISDTLQWLWKERWSFYKGEDRLEINESNTVFVKMIFPLRKGLGWDGNARNSLNYEQYRILDLDLRSSAGGKEFERTMRINHRSNINLIEEQFEEEVYARGVGLIEYQNVDLVYNVNGNAVSGRSYNQAYKAHGKK
ncbi:MAG: hypothetical protein RIE58_10145 [Vicingaceae bacterium]